jgi:hypothetical protein
MAELKDVDEVERVSRVLDPNPPEGNKALGGILVGLLTAEVNAENAKRVFSFLSDRLGGKAIELEVEANGKKLKVKAHSREELVVAMKAAQDFVVASYCLGNKIECILQRSISNQWMLEIIPNPSR